MLCHLLAGKKKQRLRLGATIFSANTDLSHPAQLRMPTIRRRMFHYADSLRSNFSRMHAWQPYLLAHVFRRWLRCPWRDTRKRARIVPSLFHTALSLRASERDIVPYFAAGGEIYRIPFLCPGPAALWETASRAIAPEKVKLPAKSRPRYIRIYFYYISASLMQIENTAWRGKELGEGEETKCAYGMLHIFLEVRIRSMVLRPVMEII